MLEQSSGEVQSSDMNTTVEAKVEITADAPATEPVKTKKTSKPKKETEKVPAAKVEESNPEKSNRRILSGKVTSNKMNKTIVVSIERQVAHPLYKKYFKRTKNIMANDPNNECNIGDVVRVRESRPLSARKRWELVDIVQRAK